MAPLFEEYLTAAIAAFRSTRTIGPCCGYTVLGRYLNETELGETLIDGPSAILYQAGAAHRNAIGSVRL